MAGYVRAQFGPEWAEVERNGCSTRDDVLARDLRRVVYRTGSDWRVVQSGTLADPYSGSTIQFHRGGGTSSAVQIDHVVTLADAWQKGAARWPPERRLHFANDPLNLLAVKGSLKPAGVARRGHRHLAAAE